MKVEIGESLVRTWVRHCRGCQLAELNWKSSPMWPGEITPEQETRTLRQIKQLDDEQQWRVLRLLMKAKLHRRHVRGELPKRPVSDDDPFWPSFRDALRHEHDRLTEV